jgi:hypothetical protein
MKKTFQIKAVEVVRRIRDKHYEILKGKSAQERIAFYRESARSMNIKSNA